MNMIIRQAVMADYEGMCAVIDEVDQLHREQHLDLFRKAPDGIVRTPGFIASLIEDPNTCFLVAEQEGEIIGLLIGCMRDTPPVSILVPRRTGYIDNLAVRRDRRRQGVGQAMMQQAEEWARRHGAEALELNVFSFNQGAIRFYEELGYETLMQRMAKKL